MNILNQRVRVFSLELKSVQLPSFLETNILRLHYKNLLFWMLIQVIARFLIMAFCHVAKLSLTFINCQQLITNQDVTPRSSWAAESGRCFPDHRPCGGWPQWSCRPQLRTYNAQASRHPTRKIRRGSAITPAVSFWLISMVLPFYCMNRMRFVTRRTDCWY